MSVLSTHKPDLNANDIRFSKLIGLLVLYAKAIESHRGPHDEQSAERASHLVIRALDGAEKLFPDQQELEETIHALAQQLGFKLEFIPLAMSKGSPRTQ